MSCGRDLLRIDVNKLSSEIEHRWLLACLAEDENDSRGRKEALSGTEEGLFGQRVSSLSAYEKVNRNVLSLLDKTRRDFRNGELVGEAGIFILSLRPQS